MFIKSLDLAGTEIGTYFQLYHAADGNACGNGVQPITGTLIKDKFEYLSHIEFSDGSFGTVFDMLQYQLICLNIKSLNVSYFNLTLTRNVCINAR